MLYRVATVQTGKSILVHGAGGAGGSGLLELSSLEKLNVFGTASAEKDESLQQFGATIIDYLNENFVEKIKQLEPVGVDLVLDGLNWHSFKRSLNTILPGDLLITYGFSNAVKKRKTAVILGFFRFRIMSVLPSSPKKIFYSITAFRNQNPDWLPMIWKNCLSFSHVQK